MKQVKSFIRWVIGAVIIVITLVFLMTNYSWVFAKKVKGKILDVQRVTNPTAIISNKVSDAQIHSYAVLIQGDDGHLYTASSEDRQWQVATKGYCVKALLYRYPPWDLERANTFFNARLEELFLCDGQSVPPSTPTGTEAAPNSAPVVLPPEPESPPAQ